MPAHCGVLEVWADLLEDQDDVETQFVRVFPSCAHPSLHSPLYRSGARRVLPESCYQEAKHKLVPMA